MKQKKMDRQEIGLVLGLVSPLFGFVLYGTGWAMYYGRTFNYFYTQVFLGTPQFQSAIVSLSVLIDLVPFFLFIRTNRLKAARGVLASIFVYMPVVIYLKFFI